MRVALVTTPASASSRVGNHVRAYLPHLRRHLEVAVFVEPGFEGERFDGVQALSAGDLVPRAFDQILFEVGNEAAHGFMLPMVRVLGGTVVLHDWDLPDATAQAFPVLAARGWGGLWIAAREGGARGAHLYLRRRRGGALSDGMTAWNRSIVRHADSFIVPRQEWLQKLLEDRNDPTPIAVIPSRSGERIEDVASEYAAALSRFPKHRSARRSVLRGLLDAVKSAQSAPVRS